MSVFLPSSWLVCIRSGITIGSFEIRFYAICILIGIILAGLAGIHEGKRLGLSGDDVFDGVVAGVICGIIGARIYYVIFEWGSFDSFGDIINIRSGGLAIHGGIIAGIIFVFVFCRIRKINMYKILDILAPGFLIGQICGRWGNFFNQEAHGGKTTYNFLHNKLHLPDFIVKNMHFTDTVWDSDLKEYISETAYWHPTFLYESTWNIIGLILIFVLRRRKKVLRLGDIMPIYLIWYSIGRFFIEGMRTDSLYIGALKQNQVISIVLIVVGIALLVLKRTIWKNKFDYYYNYLDKGPDKVPVEKEEIIETHENDDEDKYWMIDHSLDEDEEQNKSDDVEIEDRIEDIKQSNFGDEELEDNDGDVEDSYEDKD